MSTTLKQRRSNLFLSNQATRLTTKNTTIVENGHRKTTFEENKITMSSAFEMSRELAKFIAMALQQGYDRSTNDLKKLAFVCLTFGKHLRCLISDSTMTQSHLVNSFKKLIAMSLAEDSELRSRGLKVT